jgi:hypothetical protein
MIGVPTSSRPMPIGYCAVRERGHADSSFGPASATAGRSWAGWRAALTATGKRHPAGAVIGPTVPPQEPGDAARRQGFRARSSRRGRSRGTGSLGVVRAMTGGASLARARAIESGTSESIRARSMSMSMRACRGPAGKCRGRKRHPNRVDHVGRPREVDGSGAAGQHATRATMVRDGQGPQLVPTVAA